MSAVESRGVVPRQFAVVALPPILVEMLSPDVADHIDRPGEECRTGTLVGLTIDHLGILPPVWKESLVSVTLGVGGDEGGESTLPLFDGVTLGGRGGGVGDLGDVDRDESGRHFNIGRL